MKTFATLFSGGGLADIGLKAAGLTPAWAIEHDAQIAEVYRANHGDHLITAGIEDVDPMTLEAVDLLWASPPCQAHSVARSSKLPDRSDADIGIDILRYVSTLMPRVVMIENVPPYLHSSACKQLIAGLFQYGYFVHCEVLNSADYGVAQTRRRLIIRAVQGGFVPVLPVPEQWVGWYAAIEDLIPTLPESNFADWQLKRLDASVVKDMQISPTFFIGGANKSQSFLDFAVENRPSIPGIRNSDEPMLAIPADSATNYGGRAFLIPGDNASNDTVRMGDESVTTISAVSNKHQYRAFILDGKPANYAGDLQIMQEDEPIVTLTASQPRRPFRAWLVDVNNLSAREATMRGDAEPSFTIAATHMRRPVNDPKAWLASGRVVAMTPRALARFQSVPDSYILPDHKQLACKIIGNGVPSMLAEKLARNCMQD
jgi:DNA-cytosine methyltransferase